MAKKQRNQRIAAAFYYLVKSSPNEEDPQNPVEGGFTPAEFQRVVDRLADVEPVDDQSDDVISAIKLGHTLPFLAFAEVEEGLYFGDYEGAYYGQKYRNNILGEIDPASLNLRKFHYLITRLRDGRILVGVSYHGQFGDFDGLRSCISRQLAGNFKVSSKTLKNVSSEIGGGHPVSLKLTYRKSADRVERRTLFGTSGVIAIKKSDYGDDFDDAVMSAVRGIRGDEAQRRRIIAGIVNQAEMLELDENDIVGCSAVINHNGNQSTVYFLGENNFSTKFPLAVEVDENGVGDALRIRNEMVRVMREQIMPLLT